MRLTEQMRWRRAGRQLSTQRARADEAAERAATGQRVQVASDDPSAWTVARKLRSGAEAERSRAEVARSVAAELEFAEIAIARGSDALTRTKEVAVTFSDDTQDAAQMAAAADEIDALRAALTDAGNASLGGRYVFGGTSTTSEPVGAAGWQGGSARTVEVGDGARVTMPTGQEFLGPPGAGALDALDALSAALRAGDHDAVRAAQPGVDEAIERALKTQQRVGAKTVHAREAADFGEALAEAHEGESRRATEADFAEAVSTMTQATTAYEATIKLTAQIKALSRSILDL